MSIRNELGRIRDVKEQLTRLSREGEGGGRDTEEEKMLVWMWTAFYDKVAVLVEPKQ